MGVYAFALSFQDRDWEICDSIKGRIDQFKRTMPLIQDLKNSAMRDRHWTQIKKDVQKPFDQEGTVVTNVVHAIHTWSLLVCVPDPNSKQYGSANLVQ